MTVQSGFGANAKLIYLYVTHWEISMKLCKKNMWSYFESFFFFSFFLMFKLTLAANTSDNLQTYSILALNGMLILASESLHDTQSSYTINYEPLSFTVVVYIFKLLQVLMRLLGGINTLHAH